MVNAIVLMKVMPKKINEVAEKLVAVGQVSEVYSVGGRFDLVAIIRARSNEDISDVVTRHFLDLDGVESTETLIAFRVFSSHDLERMFSVGEE